MRASATIRIRIITGVILLLGLVLIARMYQIQIVRGDVYRASAERQYVHTVQDFFNRGSIFFTTRTGEHVSAATMKTGSLLAVNPSRIGDLDVAFERLSAILPLDRETFVRRVSRQGATYVEVATQLSREQAVAVEGLGMPGVSLHRDRWRYYPGNSLAAQTIGFVAYDGDELAGRYGLERYYDDILRREDERLAVNFFAEIFSDIESVFFESSRRQSGDVITSIEPTVSRILDEELAKLQAQWGSTLSGGVVINPQTGAIYALGVQPSFNLNNRAGISIEQFPNPIVESVYEMGSIIKPLTIAAGIDAGAITPASTYYDAGSVELDGYTIRNFDGRARGTVSMQEVLSQSLNTGVAHVVEEMGTRQFAAYFDALAIGRETGIDLPSEARGLVSNLESPRKIEYATASFGQGIAMTPIATVRALSALAAGGVMRTPHIAERIRYTGGGEHEIRFPEDGRVFSEETAESVTRMLVDLVDRALAGGGRRLEHHTIAAKTGTAQIANPAGGGYYDDRFLHSFFGYFPAYDPQFLVFLYTVEPKGVRYASETLTDPFMDMAQFLINYYDIPPDR